MDVLALIGRETKSLTQSIKSLPFSRAGSYGYSGSYSGNYLGNNGLYLGGGLPGAKYDYHSAAGVLWENPSAAACFVALTKAFAQARPQLKKRSGNEWEIVEDHPLMSLLSRPNNFYSGEKMFGVTLISTMSNGAAFWRLERNGTDTPSEIWFEPPVGVGSTGVAPKWDEKEFIKEYAYFVDGKEHSKALKREDVVYFRHGLNVANPRLPWSPLGLAAREIATLNGASTYTGALLRNSAVPSGMITMDSGVTGTQPTPDQAREMKERIKAGFKGENVGEPFVSSMPWKWTPFNWSPSQMSIDSIRQWPQGTVCALLGTPEIVALLPTGSQPTYQNLAASMEWWWHNTIIPKEDDFADEIETQLFPAFDLDADEYRIEWDRSNVLALKEDLSEKHTMFREDYKAGACDLYTVKINLGYEAKDEEKNVFHPSATPGNNQAEPLDPQEIEKAKRLNEAAKSVLTDETISSMEISDEELKALAFAGSELKYDPRQPRDDLGRWTDGATGRLSVGHAIHVMKAEGIHDESKHEEVSKAIEGGKHTTREDVLRHIDAIHSSSGAGGHAPSSKWNALVRSPGEWQTPEELLRHPETIRRINISVGSVEDQEMFLSQSKRHKPNTYHRVISEEEGQTGAGNGMYLGRDKTALKEFYDVTEEGKPVLTYHGEPKWLDLGDYKDYEQFEKEAIAEHGNLPSGEHLRKKAMAHGFDGIRYYDPEATGEEFVLFNTQALKPDNPDKHKRVLKRAGREDLLRHHAYQGN